MWISAAAAAPPLAHHALEVTLDPAGHAFSATDDLTLDVPPDPGGHVVWLHAGLSPRVETVGWALEPQPPPTQGGDEAPLEGYRLVPTRRKASWPVRFTFGGVVDHPPIQLSTEHQRSFAVTPGVIAPEGAALSDATAWVPSVGGLVTFSLTVQGLPEGWGVVSQGERTAAGAVTTWVMPEPTEGVHLVAGPWTETSRRYTRPDGTGVDVRAFLRTPDPELSDRYLGATVDDLALYESMLPRYPYSSFALVENWWETGWGMPGFTLLGPQVIRFPFVLTSSYPHELLHNWWGNGVYVAGGNWCEGLTAYLADHLFAEQRGQGADHRRAALQRYGDFAGAGDTLPLAAFQGRVSPATEAVGYGKAAMVFHMARRSLGDAGFLKALGRFYADHAFAEATWADLAAAVSAESGADWGPWFAAWVDRPGAPTLRLRDVAAREDGDGWLLTAVVVQDPPGFPMDVPVAITLDGVAEAAVVTASFGVGGPAEVVLTQHTASRPRRVDLDPAFDVMRRLDPGEVPPALSTLQGGGPDTVVLPARASAEERAAWEALAAAWAQPEAPRVVTDTGPLPAGDVWVVGWDNAHAAAAAGAAGVTLRPDGADVGGAAVARAGHSVVAVGPGTSGVVGFLAAEPVAAVPGLARKLPHYGKYGWLVFEGAEPTNTAKGSGVAPGAPGTTVHLDGRVPRAALPPRPPLAPAR
jgi:aminopeptidase N